MDFEKILPIILKEFKKENIKYALMGGIAMASWGIVRATVDLDCLVLADDLDKIEKIMKKYSYKCIYKTKNVSQYVSDTKIYGSIDFLHAYRDVSRGMIERAEVKKVFNNKYEVMVLCPEDLIGLKLQALNNDPKRKKKELLDIENIADILGSNLDWKTIEDYYKMFNKNKEFIELRDTYASK